MLRLFTHMAADVRDRLRGSQGSGGLRLILGRAANQHSRLATDLPFKILSQSLDLFRCKASLGNGDEDP
jgi:hypothetical protein